MLKRLLPIVLMAGVLMLLPGCGGGGGSTGDAGSAGVVTRDLLDPFPGAGELFGAQVVVLNNGNVVISDHLDSSVANQAGAVHIYRPNSMTPFASVFGDAANDSFGSGGTIALPNNNIVIISPVDDAGTVVDGGTITLIDGSSGTLIDTVVNGDDADDVSHASVVALGSDRFIVVTPRDDIGATFDAGSVRLFDATSGAQIAAPVRGNNPFDRIGDPGVTALNNGNYVIASSADDIGGGVNRGSVRLMDGSTGLEVPFSLSAGAQDGDQLGSGGVTALPNGNYVVSSPQFNVGAISDAGSVRIVNGADGSLIGSQLNGDAANDNFGQQIATISNNVLIASPSDNNGAAVNTGSMVIVSGTDGSSLTPLRFGPHTGAQLGSGGIISTNNGRFVVSSPSADNGGIAGAGAAQMISGFTGALISPPVRGDNANDQIGNAGLLGLGNGDYLVASSVDDIASLSDAGSVRLVDGVNGSLILTLGGDGAADLFSSGGVVWLPGDNIQFDDEFLVLSPNDDRGGTANAGTIRRFNSETGALSGIPITGSTALDVEFASVTVSPNRDFYVIGLPVWDNNGQVNAGRVRLVAR